MKNPGVYTTTISKNIATGERERDDYYATDPKSVEALLKVETFSKWIWEPACGEGHISKILENHGYDVISTDKVYRGYGEKESFDFLASNEKNLKEDIITNPPYSYAQQFVEKALDSIANKHKVAMLLKIQFLEGKARAKLFEKYPPKIIYVFSERQVCAKNGDFESIKGSAVCYAWFIWEKGFQGDPIIKWI